MTAHRMDSETVERLLDGTVVDLWNGRHPLVPLLTAVRAAPEPGELAGEAAAVQAYRMARLGTPMTVPGERRRGFAFAGFGGRAALVGLLVVAGAGGLALAAGGGALPNPLPAPVPAAPPSSSAPAPGGSPADGPGPRPGTASAGPGRSDPVAPLVGLCRAYRADIGDNAGRTLDNPAFHDLVEAAGGPDEVIGYCERVLAAEPGAGPAETPGARPGNQPTGRPSGLPAVPTRHPTTPGGPAPGNGQGTPPTANGPK